jgi:allantoin racemase
MKFKQILPRSATAEQITSIQSYVNSLCTPGITVDVVDIKGPPSPPDYKTPAWIKPPLDLRGVAFVAPLMIESAEKAEKEGYDAAIFSCGFDPGILSAKSALKIPIIGMAESMYRVASLLADRWGLIVGYTGMSAIIRKVIQAYGVADYVTSIKTLHVDPFQIKENRAEVEAKFIAAGKELISEDAGLVINHCSPLFAGVGRKALARIREQLGVVLDPYDTALKTAEMLVKLGLSQSRMAFPSMKLGVDPAKGVYRVEKLECYPGEEGGW